MPHFAEMSLQFGLLPTGFDVPHTDGPIATSRSGEEPVRREGHGRDGLTMSLETAQLLTARHVPETHRMIVRAAEGTLAIRRNGDAADRGRVSSEGRDFLLRRCSERDVALHLFDDFRKRGHDNGSLHRTALDLQWPQQTRQRRRFIQLVRQFRAFSPTSAAIVARSSVPS